MRSLGSSRCPSPRGLSSTESTCRIGLEKRVTGYGPWDTVAFRFKWYNSGNGIECSICLFADERIGDGILPIQLWEARQGQRVTGPRLWAGLGVVLQEPGGQAGKLQDVGSWIPMQRASIPSLPLGEQLAPGRQILTAQSKKKMQDTDGERWR